ncbi:hypothetical protein Ciccas_001830 [Cichlidogyrus casuarinus]|uniref:Uncharacterized protein n=1 Tax=Cichlidogyrus casuarinus TaxID=1844966 RepID=A0ABD2QJZ5_9PLAT
MLIGELSEHHEFVLDWNSQIPLILLCCLWGMDHSRPLVQDCCKAMLVSILRLSCPQFGNELRQLTTQMRFSSATLAHPSPFPGLRKQSFTLTDSGLLAKDTYPYLLHKMLSKYHNSSTTSPDEPSCNSSPFQPFNYGLAVQESPKKSGDQQQQYKALEAFIAFFLARNGQPLWFWEDLTTSRFAQSSMDVIISSYYEPFDLTFEARNFSNCCRLPSLASLSVDANSRHAFGSVSLGYPEYKLHLLSTELPPIGCLDGPIKSIYLIRSAFYIDQLIKLLSRLISHPVDCAHSCACYTTQDQHVNCITARLATTALEMGLSSHNRHYASRSLQIFRASGVHLDSRKFSDVISVLAEIVAEPCEDAACFIGEILLTLEMVLNHVQKSTKCIPLYRLIASTSSEAFFWSGQSLSGSGAPTSNAVSASGPNSAQSSPHKGTPTANTCATTSAPVVIVPSR